MARFRGTLQGARGQASRLGHHGITVKANGWESGVAVEAIANGDSDEFVISVTGGSNARTHAVDLGYVTSANGPRFVPSKELRQQILSEASALDLKAAMVWAMQNRGGEAKTEDCIAPRVPDERSETGFARICWCHADPQKAGFECSSCGCRS